MGLHYHRRVGKWGEDCKQQVTGMHVRCEVAEETAIHSGLYVSRHVNPQSIVDVYLPLVIHNFVSTVMASPLLVP
jgi:hypothetical protein